MLGSLNKEEIEKLLYSQVVGRIGCHADGITYVVPISYVYDGTYVYGHTQEGFKIEIMRKNPKVCFEVDTMKNMANWQSVIVQGEFAELKNGEDRKVALQKLIDRVLPVISSETTHLTPHWPFPVEDINTIKGIVYRIRLLEKSGRYENDAVRPF